MKSIVRAAMLSVTLLACRGTAPSAQVISDHQLALLVDSLAPGVAKATGLEFKSTPKSAIRTKEQIRAYLVAKMARELPLARLNGIMAAYRLLDMLPDTLDLQKLFLDLYTEQVAGFYDPDSTTLFAVQGGNPAELRLVLAHELVHALQDQYLPLDSILHDASDGDRQAAAQAVLEGQATLASVMALFPGLDVATNDALWATVRDQTRSQQTGMRVYDTAPMVIREGLTFPYIDGAEFMRWFDRTHPGVAPFGALLPESTEQILHPERYASGDTPLPVRFTGDTAGVVYEDTFGEFDVELLRAQLAGAAAVRTDPAIGWGGDRLRVYGTRAGPALVWVTVWDEPRYAQQFQAEVAGPLSQRPRRGYRVMVEPRQVGGRAAVEIVVAPVGWERWKSLPRVELQ